MTYSEKAYLNAVMIGEYPDDWTEFWIGELFDCETLEEVNECLSDFLETVHTCGRTISVDK